MKDRERIVDELFAQAVELGPAERRALLAEKAAEGGVLLSEGVIAEVESLLRDFQSAEDESFLHWPLVSAEALEERRQTLAEGQEFEGYRILKLIAEGGMGEVYLAEDAELERRVAIKLVKGGLKTRELLRRFHSERQILANLQHPNIARLFEAGATPDGLPFFVMEYVEGRPIDGYADEHNLSVAQRLKLFLAVCSAVSHAHRGLVIHRDIKPGNILVTEEGEPKLLDFGIAKLLDAADSADQTATATLFRAMTPEYASPEQVRGEPITTATDVYSLGVLLYELLTGERPYKLTRRTTDEITRAICEQEPAKPSSRISEVGLRDAGSKTDPKPAFRNPKLLRGDLDNIVLEALRKEPERRYASVEQFAEDIRRHLEGLPVTARKDTFSYRASKFVRRNRAGVAAAALVLLTLVGGIIATAWQAHVAGVERARAENRFNEVRELAHSVLFNYHDAIASLPGSTPVREQLVKDALKYLDELADDEGNSPSLQRELAAAYLKVGDVQGRPYVSNLGQTDGALESYRKAAAILEPLAAGSPSDISVARDLATVYERIGNIQLRKGDISEALDKNNKALGMRQALLAVDPTSKSYRGEVADSYLFVGDALQVECGDVECVQRALDSQRQALTIREALAQENPSEPQLRRGVAQAYARIGFRFNTLHDLAKTQEYLRQWMENEQAALTIRQELVAADPTNAFDRRNLADQLMLTGNALMENRDVTGTLSVYRDSLDIFKALSSADPTNAEARRDLSYIYIRLAAALNRTGDARAARQNYAEVLRITEQLIAEDSASDEDLQTEVATYEALSRLSEAEGDLPGAIESYRKVLDLSERIAAAMPGDPHSEYMLVSYSQELGALYMKLAKQNGIQKSRQIEAWRDARGWYLKSSDILQDMKGKGTLNSQGRDWSDNIAAEISLCSAALKKLGAD
jgi:non-specific serine/threonine protein kinase/serine/threonine-protein kinase